MQRILEDERRFLVQSPSLWVDWPGQGSGEEGCWKRTERSKMEGEREKERGREPKWSWLKWSETYSGWGHPGFG